MGEKGRGRMLPTVGHNCGLVCILLSCVSGILVFGLDLYTLHWPYAESSANGCLLSASVMNLQMCDKTTTTMDFCSRDETVCHHAECEGAETDFCDVNEAAKGIAITSICCLLLSITYLASLALRGYGYRIGYQSQHLTRIVTCLHITAAVLCVVVAPLWAVAKSQLPDLTKDGQWLYLPKSQSLIWKADDGFFAQICITALFSCCSAALGVMGSSSVADGSYEGIPEQTSENQTEHGQLSDALLCGRFQLESSC